MAEEEPSERKNVERSATSRRSTLTPEQRRFMGTPRREEPAREAKPIREVREEEPEPPTPEPVAVVEEKAPVDPPAKRKGRTKVSVIKTDMPLASGPDQNWMLLSLGALVVLGLVFYAGMKFPGILHRIYSKSQAPTLDASVQQKYTDLSAEELVAQGLAAERAGNFQEATDKLIAAKHKDLGYRGILFHVGKIAYDHGDFDAADKLLERSIAFNENVDRANYLRGLLAVRRKDLPAAQRFFAEAAKVDPFEADYQYYWAEALRMDHRPNESMARYEQAASLSPKSENAKLCQFKLRLARLEAGDVKMAGEIEAKKNASDLSVDWLMTEAAFDLRGGHMEEALPLIKKAAATDPALFSVCANDQFFLYAASKDPQLAQALKSAGPASPNE